MSGNARDFRFGLAAAAIVTTVAIRSAPAAPITGFTPGDLVISTVSCSVSAAVCDSISGGLDTVSPITLQEYQLAGGTAAKPVGASTLPQTSLGSNSAISGEYGSASEGFLQRSADGRYLTIMGYGVNAATFNNAPPSTYGTAALGQTTSLTAANQTGTIYTTVPRVVALIGANGSVDTSTALTGVFNTNNARSAATVNGSSFYVSGQGASKTDPTQGVFLAARGATTATPIDNSTDTRAVSIFNEDSGNTLYVSRDYNPPGSGSQNFSNVSSLPGPAAVCRPHRPGLSPPTSFPPRARFPAAATTARSI